MRISFRCSALVFISLLSGIPNLASGSPRRDPRLAQVGDLLENRDVTLLFAAVSASDWTKGILQTLSNSERTHLAKVLRKAETFTIRDGHLEQFRVQWRSADLPDSECVVSFLMDARPGDLTRPLIVFSSRVDKMPEVLARAMEENRMPLVISFYDPASSWIQLLPKMGEAERKNMTAFYRSLRVQESRPEEWVYTGTRVDQNGIVRQEDLKLQLNFEGRWVVE